MSVTPHNDPVDLTAVHPLNHATLYLLHHRKPFIQASDLIKAAKTFFRGKSRINCVLGVSFSHQYWITFHSGGYMEIGLDTQWIGQRMEPSALPPNSLPGGLLAAHPPPVSAPSELGVSCRVRVPAG